MTSVEVITGAARGIGAAIARQRARPHCQLLLLDRDGAALAQVASDCQQQGANVSALELDFASHDWLAQLHPLLQQYGRVDLLVNNAGIAAENDAEDIAGWQRIMTINLEAPVRLTAACLPWMSSGGRIINISSILGRAGKVRNTGYCASKHGLLGYSKALAMDLAPQGITVNAVLPGWVETPMLQQELAAQAEAIGSTSQQVLRNARRQLPIKRLVAEAEVAAMVDYLASPQAAAVTAQSLVIDGGFTCGM